MKPGSKVVLALAGLVIAAAGALQVIGVRDLKEGDRAKPVHPIGLSERLPRELAGWAVRDEPLGPSEAVRDAVAKNLNYDDYVYRVFERGGTRLGVYIAYWSAGRMPINKVASHTPDRCWVENGWRCDAARFGERWNVSGAPELLPGQGREFLPPHGEREYVLFWHKVGGRLYDFGDRLNTKPDPLKWWRDTVAYAFSGSDEQYFVRLTSNRPLAELKDESAFAGVVKVLAELGLKGGGAEGRRGGGPEARRASEPEGRRRS